MSRAASTRDVDRPRAIEEAISCQWPGGMAVQEKSDQNTAICVCSGVRVRLPRDPICFTSFSASAYSGELSAGGGGGTYGSTDSTANGVTNPHWGVSGGRKNGGVRRQAPGASDGM